MHDASETLAGSCFTLSRARGLDVPRCRIRLHSLLTHTCVSNLLLNIYDRYFIFMLMFCWEKIKYHTCLCVSRNSLAAIHGKWIQSACVTAGSQSSRHVIKMSPIKNERDPKKRHQDSSHELEIWRRVRTSCASLAVQVCNR